MTQLHEETDGLSKPEGDVLIVGCGNLLRGDDGVGPVLIRHLWERGIPDGAGIVDGGTAGMDVAFRMRGARKVVIIDAASTQARPGTIYRVPGPALADLPALEGLHTHSFRWDHALAFANWLLKDEYPQDVTVFLIEAENVDAGMDLSPAVSDAMEQVIEIIERDFLAELRTKNDSGHPRVEFTADGYLRLDAATANQYFPNDSVVAVRRDDELWMIPLRGPESGGLLLKQRTPAGDRCVIIREVLDDRQPHGTRTGYWDDAHGALRIPLDLET